MNDRRSTLGRRSPGNADTSPNPGGTNTERLEDADLDLLLTLVRQVNEEFSQLKGTVDDDEGWMSSCRTLNHHAGMLADEELGLHSGSQHERDHFRHKVRQHCDRVQACLTDLRNAAIKRRESA